MILCIDQDKHLGTIVAPRPKCSSEGVAATKAKKKQEKQVKATKQALAVKKAAHLEDQMEREDEENGQQANHPPVNLKKRELWVCKEGLESKCKYNM